MSPRFGCSFASWLFALALVACSPSELNLEQDDELECVDSFSLCDGACVEDDQGLCGDECAGTCGADQVCFKGNCTNTCAAGCSSTLQVCSGGICDCREGLNWCEGACVDLSTDAAHCGVCGRACGTGQLCDAGQCVGDACVDSPEICEGACTNIDDDNLNCGMCGRACESNEICIASACKVYFSVSPSQCTTCPCEPCDLSGRLCCQTEFLEGRVLCVDSDSCF